MSFDFNKSVGDLSSKVSGNCLQICRGTVSKSRVGELSCSHSEDPAASEDTSCLRTMSLDSHHMMLVRSGDSSSQSLAVVKECL